MYKIEKGKLFYSSLKVLTFTALAPNTRDQSGLRNFYIKFFLARLLCLVTFVALPVHHLITSLRDNIETDISEDLSIIMGGSGAMATCCLFTLNYEKWSQLFTDISDTSRFGKPSDFDQVRKRLNLISNVYFWYAYLGTLLYGLAAYLESFNCKRINEERGIHELCGTFSPIRLQVGLDYEWVWMPIFLVQMVLSGFMVGPSALICLMVFEVTEVLVSHIRKLKRHFLEVFEADGGQEMLERLRYCVRYHNHILSLGYRLNRLVRFTVGHLSLISAVVFGCIANQILKNKPMGASLFLVGYMVAFFWLCHAGQRILDEALSVSNAVYNSKWYRGDVKTMRSFRLIIARSQIPLVLDALPLGSLNYPLFLMVPEHFYHSYPTKFLVQTILLKVLFLIFNVLAPLMHFGASLAGRAHGGSISEDISIAFAQLNAFLLVFTQNLRYKDLLALLKDVTDFRRFGKNPDFDQLVRRLNLISKAYSVYCFFAGVFYSLSGYLQLAPCQKQNEEQGYNEICGTFTPVWLPFDVGVWEITAIFSIQFILFCYITIPSALTCYMTWEVTEVLISHVQHLKGQFLGVFDEECPRKRSEKLRAAIEHHNHLIKIGSRLSTFVKYSSGIVSSLSAVALSCLGNQFLNSKPMGALSYLGGYMIALSMLCHSGQRIRDESLELGGAIYASKWYDASTKQMKDVLYILARCQTPITLEILPFGALDYPLFLLIMKTSYSYLTLLSQTM